MLLLLAKRSSLVLAIVMTIGLASSSHIQHCKKTLRQRMFELCSGGFREKRSSPLIDALDPAADFASVVEESHTRKRQIMSIREIIVSSRVPMPELSYRALPPALWARQPSNVETPPDETVPQPRRRLEPLPQESGSDVGFDISYDEMIELYNEIYGRSSRSTFEDFKPVAYECCKNEELCLTKKNINLRCP